MDFHIAVAGVFICACVVLQAQASGLTAEEKEEILNAHNYYRGLVQPLATNMNKMEWSDELGYIAQFWAIGCEYMANENRHDQSQDFDVVGESRLATLSYSVNYTNLLGTWFSEKKYYDYDTATCTVYDDEEEEEEERRASGGEVEGEEEDGEGVEKEDEEQDECGRYTQMVWATTNVVGCGAFRCEELRGSEDGENALYFICNYGPGGNYYGAKPYNTGSEPCSECGSDKPYCEDNLCSDNGILPFEMSVFSCLLLCVVAYSAIH